MQTLLGAVETRRHSTTVTVKRKAVMSIAPDCAGTWTGVNQRRKKLLPAGKRNGARGFRFSRSQSNLITAGASPLTKQHATIGFDQTKITWQNEAITFAPAFEVAHIDSFTAPRNCLSTMGASLFPFVRVDDVHSVPNLWTQRVCFTFCWKPSKPFDMWEASNPFSWKRPAEVLGGKIGKVLQVLQLQEDPIIWKLFQPQFEAFCDELLEIQQILLWQLSLSLHVVSQTSERLCQSLPPLHHCHHLWEHRFIIGTC